MTIGSENNIVMKITSCRITGHFVATSWANSLSVPNNVNRLAAPDMVTNLSVFGSLINLAVPGCAPLGSPRQCLQLGSTLIPSVQLLNCC